MITEDGLTRRFIATVAVAAAIGTAVALVAGDVYTEPASAQRASAAKPCPVTEPGPVVLPGGLASDHWIARNGLYVGFGSKTTIAVVRGHRQSPPGTVLGRYVKLRGKRVMYAKTPWWRDSNAYGTLRVTGVRRSGRDRLVDSRYDNHLGPDSEVVPGALVFPRAGCWRITGTSGDATLRAIVRVVQVG